MQQTDEVTLTIDGKEVAVPKGTLVLHAAQKLGIDVPTFCYNNKMDPLGACRMCLVSIEKQKGFPPACATPVAPGMIVTTKSEAVEQTRKSMLEFLLINHPLDCPICDKGGECPLQNLTFKFGPGRSRFVENKRRFQKHLQVGPQIVLDRERCILCQLCVRFMEDIVDDAQLVMINRGDSTEIGTFPGRPLDSVFSGNVTDICPVGALTSQSYRFQSRPWDLAHTPSVCPTCPVGCNIDVNTRRGQLMRLTPRENITVDDGWLCDIGRYGTLSWARYERVTSPLIKKNGHFLPASWDEALQAAEDGLRAARTGGTLAGLASARGTNEELYLFGRLLRGGLRTPHLDTLNGSRGGTATLGGAPIAAIEDADAIVLVDADPIARQMVLHLRLTKQAKRRGIQPVIISNDDTGLDKFAGAKLSFQPTNLSATVRALADAVRAARASLNPAAAPRTGSDDLRSGQSGAAAQTDMATLATSDTAAGPQTDGQRTDDQAAPGHAHGIAGALAGLSDAVSNLAETVTNAVPGLTHHESQEGPAGQTAQTGAATVSAGAGAQATAARPEALLAAGQLLATAKRGLVVYDERVLDEPDGQATLDAIRDLEALLAELDTLPTARVLALSKDTNSRGAAEMGVAPAVLPGGRPMSDLAWFNEVQSSWGLPMLNETGLDDAGILRAAAGGELDGLFLMDTDPIMEWPDEDVAREALARVPFLLAQTALLTPSAQQADVILPAAGVFEESGSLTNLEGRVQTLGRAVEIPGEARDGWDILAELSNRFGVIQTYESAAVVSQEIADTLRLPAWQALGQFPEREPAPEQRELVTAGGDA